MTAATAGRCWVLSEEDWAFWIHNGYIVIKNAVPRQQAAGTAAQRIAANENG
jgi:hypothetical protein